jgi:hypothetical protein
MHLHFLSGWFADGDALKVANARLCQLKGLILKNAWLHRFVLDNAFLPGASSEDDLSAWSIWCQLKVQK